MTKLLTTAAIALLSISAFAQDSTSVSTDEINNRIRHARQEMTEKMDDELANLPKDIQDKCNDARNKADRLGKEIQDIRKENLDPNEMKERIDDLIRTKKVDAEKRINDAIERIDAYKNGHKDEIDAAHAEVKTRIERKRAEMEEKRAEIEAKIAAKRAEIEAALAEKDQD